MDRDIDRYAQAYRGHYGFEGVMVHYRRELVVRRFAMHRPRTVIEVGCGLVPLPVELAGRGGTWDHWHVVEPASAFIAAAREGIAQAGLDNVTVHAGFFEEVGLRHVRPDMIICAGLLHEVPSSLGLLRHVADTMAAETVLHVSVPNAASFHRRLARAMGLIERLDQFSQRNADLDQRRVFDMEMLVSDLERTGLRVTETGGILIKPFSHAQMEGLGAVLSREVLDGLDVLGQEHPEWASEIWAEAVLA